MRTACSRGARGRLALCSRAGRTTAVLLCLLMGVACGCGTPDTTEVFGKVTLNGKPIEDGDISFLPEAPTAGPQSSAPIRNGEYRISGEWGLAPNVPSADQRLSPLD
jgi:hypothetical protein